MTAVLSVGLAEGSSHVNWKKVRYTIVWWAVGFGVVMLCTSVLVAQGTFALALYTVHSCVVNAVCLWLTQHAVEFLAGSQSAIAGSMSPELFACILVCASVSVSVLAFLIIIEVFSCIGIQPARLFGSVPE